MSPDIQYIIFFVLELSRLKETQCCTRLCHCQQAWWVPTYCMYSSGAVTHTVALVAFVVVVFLLAQRLSTTENIRDCKVGKETNTCSFKSFHEIHWQNEKSIVLPVLA